VVTSRLVSADEDDVGEGEVGGTDGMLDAMPAACFEASTGSSLTFISGCCTFVKDGGSGFMNVAAGTAGSGKAGRGLKTGIGSWGLARTGPAAGTAGPAALSCMIQTLSSRDTTSFGCRSAWRCSNIHHS
jgi:hypothetical protein